MNRLRARPARHAHEDRVADEKLSNSEMLIQIQMYSPTAGTPGWTADCEFDCLGTANGPVAAVRPARLSGWISWYQPRLNG